MSTEHHFIFIVVCKSLAAKNWDLHISFIHSFSQLLVHLHHSGALKPLSLISVSRGQFTGFSQPYCLSLDCGEKCVRPKENPRGINPRPRNCPANIWHRLGIAYGCTVEHGQSFSFGSIHQCVKFLLAGDEILLQQTLFDAVVTAPLEAYWTALMLTGNG